MLDNKTLQRWSEIRINISKLTSEMNLYGSDWRDPVPEVAALLFETAITLYQANRLLDKAILRASAEEDENE